MSSAFLKKAMLLALACPLLFSCNNNAPSGPSSDSVEPSSETSSEASSESNSESESSSDSTSEASSSSSADSSSGSSSSSSESSSVEEACEFQTLRGSLDYRDYGATSKSSSSSLITNRRFNNGTVSMEVMPGGEGSAGFAFRSDVMMASYYYLYVDSPTGGGSKMVLSKRENGADTVVGYCYISAGHSKTTNVELKVIVNDGKIQCFYDDKLFISRVDESPLSGAYVGLKTSNAGTIYEDISISKANDFKTVDTLVTGHSYMELWSNYKTDLSRYPDIFNIGIGGTSSNDWAGHVEEVVDYHPNRLIYMIGINDVGWKRTPADFMQYVKAYLNPLLTRLPNLQVALVSVNNCPLYKDSQATIDAMNGLLKDYAIDHDRVFYANVDKAFLKDDGTPDGSCFTDGLHPTANAYLTIRDAIYDAFDNKNQPTWNFDTASGKAVANEIKANASASDWTFSENEATMNSTGFYLSSSTYTNFSVALDMSGVSDSAADADNPFFSHKATKAFLFGGSVDTNGKYQGYALNFSKYWFQILKLDGYDSTFIDGWNVDPEGVKVRLTLNGSKCTLTYVGGATMGSTFSNNTEVTLSDYSGGKVGLLRNDTSATLATIHEFK